MEIEEMEKIKLCFFMNGFANGGVEAVVYNYITHMDLGRFEVSLLCYDSIADERNFRKFEALGVRIIRIPVWKQDFVGSCRRAAGIFREERFDIIHSHMSDLNWLPLLLALAADRKAIRISHSHMSYYHVKLPFGRRLLHAAEFLLGRMVATDYFACGMNAAMTQFGKRCVQSGEVCLMRNAIDVDRFRFCREVREERRKKWGLEGCFVLGCIARFEKQKNHAFLIRLFERFALRYPDVRLLLAGCGSLEGEMRRLVREKGLEGKVIFAGTTNQAHILYQAMDVFLLPSLYEGLGMTCIEAQAAGLPVLASDAVPREAGITGLIQFLPIGEGCDEKWIEALAGLIGFERQETDEGILRNAGYDIRTEAKELERKYRSMLGGGVKRDGDSCFLFGRVPAFSRALMRAAAA